MSGKLGIVMGTALLVAGTAIAADAPKMTPEQEAMMKAGMPGAQHATLAKTAGEYDAKVKMWETPGGTPSEDSATVTRKMDLEGRVLVEEFHGTMAGMPFTGHGMTGYDNTTGKYWSTWNDSMSTALGVSSGTCDAKNVCTFKSSMTDPVTKKQKF